MSVPVQTTFTEATANGVTTNFPFGFLIKSAADLMVTIDGAAPPMAYTVNGIGATTGSVSFALPPAAGSTILMQRDITLARTTDYQYQGEVPSKTLNDDFDRIWMALQGFFSTLFGAVRAPFPEQLSSLPRSAVRANRLLSFDNTGMPITVAPADGSASALAVILAGPSGANGIGFNRYFDGSVDWTIGEKISSDPINVLEAIPKSQRAAIVSGISVYDASVAINKVIQAANGRAIDFGPHRYYCAAPLNFAGWTGCVTGDGATIAFAPGVSMAAAVDFSNADGVFWGGVSLDMGQSASTVDADPRVRAGFYMRDARNCSFRSFDVKNVRVGQIIYIDGTSSVSPAAAHGSRNIKFHDVSCDAFPYNTLDLGAGVYIRSDFYTDTGGGAYYAASNACRLSDFTLDPAVAYARTTSEIYFSDCTFKNFDRIGYFNVRDVHMTNVKLINFYTRGHTLSPSCEKVTVIGGSISGNAAQINANFCCQDIVFADLVADGMTVSTGQRHALRCGFGTKRARFSNIVGRGSDTAQIYIEGAQDITFEGVSLDNWPGGATTKGLTVVAGNSGNTTSFVTQDIRLIGCTLGANYGMEIATVAGTGVVAQRGVTIEATRFNKTLQLFLGAQPTNGPINWTNSYATPSASLQDLDPRAFSHYSGGNLSLRKWDQYTWAVGASPYATFSTVYFPTTVRDGGGQDNTRDVPVRAFVKKTGQTFFSPLVYGLDWFIDATIAAQGMANQIRMVTSANFANGDIIAIERTN